MDTQQDLLHAAAVRLSEARRRTDALSVYSRRMAHDLSNFLTVIRTYSELLIADTPANHASRPDLDEIAQAADTTVGYVQRVSAFSRAASAKVGPLALHDLVSDVVALAQTSSLAPVALDAKASCTITGSSAVLAETIQELLANARDASPSDAVIAVRTHVKTIDAPLVEHGVPLEAGAWAVVEIIDSGAGVPESIAENVFDPFITGKPGVRGAGFGLAIARCAAWSTGGQVTLGRENERTVARLYFPVHQS